MQVYWDFMVLDIANNSFPLLYFIVPNVFYMHSLSCSILLPADGPQLRHDGEVLDAFCEFDV